MSEGGEVSAQQERSEHIMDKHAHCAALLNELYPDSSSELQEGDIDSLSQVLYDYRSYEPLEASEDMKRLYRLYGLEIPEKLGESLVLSEGVIPLLLAAGYELELPIDVENTNGINNVDGMSGGDFVFRMLEQRLLEIVGTDPKTRVIVRAGGDEYLGFKKKAISSNLDMQTLNNRLQMNILLSDTPIQLVDRGVKTTYNAKALTLKEDTSMRETMGERKIPAVSHELPEQFAHLSKQLQSLVHAQIYDAFFQQDPVLRAPYYQKFFQGEYPYGVRFSMSGLKEINDEKGKKAGNTYITNIFESVRDAVSGQDVRIIRLGGTTFQIQIRPKDGTGKNPFNTVANTVNKITASLPREWEGKPLFYGASHNLSLDAGTYRKLDAVPPDMNYAECLTRWKYLLESQRNPTRYQSILASNKQYMIGKRSAVREKTMEAAFQNMHAQFPTLHDTWMRLYADLMGNPYPQVKPGLEFNKKIDPGYIV